MGLCHILKHCIDTLNTIMCRLSEILGVVLKRLFLFTQIWIAESIDKYSSSITFYKVYVGGCKNR